MLNKQGKIPCITFQETGRQILPKKDKKKT